jgi:hypothetical protein
MERKTRWKLDKNLAKKMRRRTEKWEELHMMVVVKELLSPS